MDDALKNVGGSESEEVQAFAGRAGLPSSTCKITAHNYPKLLEAMNIISHDSGARAGHKAFDAPHRTSGQLARYELQLGLLSDAEFEIFCIGEGSEISELIRTRSGSIWLDACHDFLDDFFKAGCPCACKDI